MAALSRPNGKDEKVVKVEVIQPVALTQENPLVLGQAAGLAGSILGDFEDCFAVMLPCDGFEPNVP
ncbi:hypothetical protein [Corynebacterium sp. ACRPO]|uniref:hypothetical protein n=1 Tax=Corynebacterium sp. ACRPO TaxID=2918200 RepID=UPI001EF553B2|nr:hypothetical protein [Corynebacterium sp. ACRPO]MCG7445768.1 hypothetical protein [Corynebacterium sp. ACRPO]